MIIGLPGEKVMKILTVADVESKGLWEHLDREYLRSIDLILAAGDLKPDYLEYLGLYSPADILHVYGNHDRTHGKRSPGGCICVEDTIYNYKGIRVLGLGGSIRYKPGPDQYTEAEMKSRVHKLWLKLKRHKGIDILVTHAPAYQFNDGEDLPHSGFQVFRDLLDKYKPKYFVHGHIHKSYSHKFKRFDSFMDTTIVNACERCIVEYKEK